MKKTRKWILPLACYVAALVVYLLFCLFYLARDTVSLSSGELERQKLWLEDFQLESIHQLETEDGVQRFVSTDPDPQMIYRRDTSFRVSRVVFNAEAINKPQGSMVLYYTTHLGEEFSDAKKVWAKLDQEGNWYFDLNGQRLTAIRLDPDSEGGVIWNVHRIVLNERKSIAEYFIPDGFSIFLVLFLPAFLAGVIFELLGIFTPFFARRKFDSRWHSREKNL